MFSRYWRQILFFFFAAGFLISAPAVVLFTAGYRYHFASGKIVQTGIMNIHSIPKGANVLIDGKLQKERTPAVISNVIPGFHEVRVEKEGYSSWKKTLEVSSKQSTFVEQAVLFLMQDSETNDGPLVGKNPAIKPEWNQTPLNFKIQNTSDRSVLSFVDENNLASIIAYLPPSDYAIEPAPAPYLLLKDETRGRLVLVDIVNTTQPILLNTDAIQWAWSLSGETLLFSDGFDIEAYTPSLHFRETLTRFSQPIFGLTWYPKGRLVVFGYTGNIFALELDRRGEPNKTTLMEELPVKEYWFENEGEWLVGILEDGRGFKKRLQK